MEKNWGSLEEQRILHLKLGRSTWSLFAMCLILALRVSQWYLDSILHRTYFPHSLACLITHHSSIPSAGSPTVCLVTSCLAEGRTAQQMGTLGLSLTLISDCASWTSQVKWGWWSILLIHHWAPPLRMFWVLNAIQSKHHRYKTTEMGEKLKLEFCYMAQ